MNPPIVQLEQTLAVLVETGRELAGVMQRQREAMQVIDTQAMARLSRRQEQLHRRMLRLENDRRRLVGQVCPPRRVPGQTQPTQVPPATLVQLAEMHPARRDRLLALRQDLRQAADDVRQHTRACTRVATGMLNGLNAAVRLLHDATTYTAEGAFTLPPPRRRMDAVG